VSQTKDIYIAEIFQHGRWKRSLNVQSTQLDIGTDCTERDKKDEKMGEKIIREKLMGKACMKRRR
jgi:hypothetical protein